MDPTNADFEAQDTWKEHLTGEYGSLSYEEDARELIRMLRTDSILLPNGLVNPIGVQILIKTAEKILENESVMEV